MSFMVIAARIFGSAIVFFSLSHLPHLWFELEIMWSQRPNSSGRSDVARAVFNYTLQDYTGNYTVTHSSSLSDQPKYVRKTEMRASTSAVAIILCYFFNVVKQCSKTM